jgi:hypothetical protein
MPPIFTRKRLPDLLLAGVGIAALIVIITRYGMPFRMDDVLYIQWANHHSILDAFSPSNGELFLSFRPVIAIVFWLLTHLAGTEQYWIWHLVLVGSFFTAIAFTGRTARFISEKDSALQISSVVYWLAFLPILNILFWFADMTYALEMMFVSIAWYYGLRAIDDPKLKTWTIANIFGILAVLSKEPALLMIHGVWIGAIYLKWRKFKRGIKRMTSRERIIWSVTYGIFFLISLNQYILSNATSTRFFHISVVPHDQMMFFVKDRIRYYTETLCTVPFIVYMLVALLGIISANSAKLPKRRAIYACIVTLIAIILWIVSKPLLITFFLVAFFVFSIQGTVRATRMAFASLFALIAIVNVGFLLITVMLVKTQLAELSFLLSVIGGAGASLFIANARDYIKQNNRSLLRIGVPVATVIVVIGACFVLLPKLKAKEQLLRDVKTTRTHANDAVKWIAKNLPTDATVLVTGSNMFGIADENQITSYDDEFKLRVQHTFHQGFIRAYYQALGRSDLHLGYLEDSTIATRTLDSCRNIGGYYLFLQTVAEVERFHQIVGGVHLLNNSDSLCANFNSGGFPCEIWRLRN